VAFYERLSAQDASFLHLESERTPMHVGSLAIFEGGPFFEDGRFRIEDVRRTIASRLHLVPRFRMKLMEVPLGQGRPVWVDDEDFDIGYHVRLTALPAPGSEEQLKTLCARVQATTLDRTKPLWEMWYVEGLADDRVAVIQKTHHALVDGVSGVDVATVCLDFTPEPPPIDAPKWEPQPAPSSAQLLRETVVERATQPAELVRTARALTRGPRRAFDQGRTVARSFGSMIGRNTLAPKSPINQDVGRHRRFEPVRVSLADAKTIKGALGGTINDVVLASVAGGLRHLLSSRGEPVDGLVLKAMVPVSVRDDTERMKLGNRVSAMFASLPVGEPDPVERLRLVREAMGNLKESQQAVGAEFLVGLTEYASPTLLGLAARLMQRQRFFNLVVTNVPGPQIPLYSMGARMLEAFPIVPLAANQTVCIGILSYDGALNFGLLGDRDAATDLATLAEGIDKAIDELRVASSDVRSVDVKTTKKKRTTRQPTDG
jgi:WS/DGAT/MGAT family acyltransferase